MGLVVGDTSAGELAEVAGAHRPPRILPRPPQRRQEQGDEHGDDADDHEQLDERNRASSALLQHVSLPGDVTAGDRSRMAKYRAPRERGQQATS